MLKETKSYLSKLILISFIFVFLFLPLKPAHAIFGIGDIGIFDFAKVQLDALDFVDNVVLQVIIFVCILIFESVAFIATAAILLQWAINLPINLGVTNPNANLLVSSGWNFTSGLVNILFILTFVLIALAYILRLETFGMKKAIPRLILIALLVNFSLVFVGALVDISDIFRNGIVNAIGDNVVTLAIAPLQSSAWSVAAWFLAIPATYLISALIPQYNVAAIVGIALLFFSDIAGITGGILLKGLFLIVINFVIGGIFFFYSALFIMRIGIIWILAILAPLAFFCYILPQTQKHWSEWFKTLLEWLILGIVVLFLAGLGLKLFAITGSNALLAWGSDINTGVGILPGFFYNYFFLLIYLGIVWYYSMTKLVPMLGTVLMDYGKSFGKGVGKIATARTMEKKIWGPAAEKVGGAMKGVTEWSERLQTRGAFKLRGKTVQPFAPFAQATRGFAATAERGLIGYTAKVRRFPIPKEFDEISSPEQAETIKTFADKAEQLQLLARMRKLDTLKFEPEMLKMAEEHMGEFAENPYYKKEVAMIKDYLPDKITEKIAIDFEVGEEAKDKIKGKIDEMAKTVSAKAEIDVEINKTIEEKMKETGLSRKQVIRDIAAGTIHVEGMKPGDMREANKGSLNSLAFRLGSHKFSGSHFQRIQEEFGKEVLDNVFNGTGGLNQIFENKTPEQTKEALGKIYSDNSRLVHFFAETPAGKQLNWMGLKFMPKGNKGRPDFDAFVAEMEEKGPPPPKPPPPEVPPIEITEEEKKYQAHLIREKFTREEEDRILKGKAPQITQPRRPDGTLTPEAEKVLTDESWYVAEKQLITETKELMKKPSPLAKVTREIPKEIKGVIKEGDKYISGINEKINVLKSLDGDIKELERDLATLKAKAVKTAEDEEFIRRTEVELLPQRREQLKSTKESVRETKTRLNEIRKQIETWEETEKARKKGEEEEKRIKEVYKKLKKETKK